MAGDTKIFELLKLDPHIQDVIQHLPVYNEFDEHDLSEKQKIGNNP